MPDPGKVYLGDAVYAEYDGYGVRLTVEYGMGAEETIVMDPEVLDALDKYRKILKE